MVTFRVWFRNGDKRWWEPVTAESEEQALGKMSKTKRNLVSKVQVIKCACAVS